MTEQDHPINLSGSLWKEWIEDGCDGFLAACEAARWGADQELEACCDWLRNNGLYETRISHLRAARRPEPLPSLKQQALQALENADLGPAVALTPVELSIVRRALEALPDD